MKIIAKRIKLARESISMSQEKLADLTHLHPSAIGHYEAGSRVPSAQALADLARSLRTSADYLLGIESEHEERRETALRRLAGIIADFPEYDAGTKPKKSKRSAKKR